MKSIIFLFLQLILSVEAFEKPKNTLTSVSQRTVLKCCSDRTNAELYWKFKKWDVIEAIQVNKVCGRQECIGNYSSEMNDTCLNLVIPSTTREHAGLYQCVELVEERVTTTGAYLVVYDNFTCAVNVSENTGIVEGETVLFHCSVTWIGKLPFEIQWATNRIINKTVFSQQQKQNVYTAFLKVVVERPALRPHTATVVFRNEGTSGENIDMSTPNITRITENYLVIYPVSYIRTSCPDDNNCQAKPDDRIKCSADGHPPPKFQWEDWDKKPLFSNATLYVNFSESKKVCCVATNIVRGSEKNDKKCVSVRVEKEMIPFGRTKDDPYELTKCIIGGILLSLILIAVVIYAIVSYRQRKEILKRIALLPNDDISPKIYGKVTEDQDNMELKVVPSNDEKKPEENLPYSIQTTN